MENSMLLRVMFLATVLLLSSFAAVAEPNDPTAVTTNKIANRFAELDRDGDGVSLSEFMRMVRQRAELEYKQMDANRDGRVSRSEYKRFWNKRKAQYYRIKR